eukprot:1202018-Pleurochrysis_carterae.AAC.1
MLVRLRGRDLAADLLSCIMLWQRMKEGFGRGRHFAETTWHTMAACHLLGSSSMLSRNDVRA